MQNKLVFKTGLVKRVLGWSVVLAFLGAMLAMIYGFMTHPESQTATELWSGVAIGVFLICLMVMGVAIQYIRWSIEGETIVFDKLFANKVIPISDLAGYGKLIIVMKVFPMAHIELYDRELNRIARLPVGLKNLPRAEAWLADRLRYVINDGSAALPKLRYADTSNI